MTYLLQAKDAEEPREAWANWMSFNNPREALAKYEEYKELYSKQFRVVVQQGSFVFPIT